MEDFEPIFAECERGFSRLLNALKIDAYRPVVIAVVHYEFSSQTCEPTFDGPPLDRPSGRLWMEMGRRGLPEKDKATSKTKAFRLTA